MIFPPYPIAKCPNHRLTLIDRRFFTAFLAISPGICFGIRVEILPSMFFTSYGVCLGIPPSVHKSFPLLPKYKKTIMSSPKNFSNDIIVVYFQGFPRVFKNIINY